MSIHVIYKLCKVCKLCKFARSSILICSHRNSPSISENSYWKSTILIQKVVIVILIYHFQMQIFEILIIFYYEYPHSKYLSHSLCLHTNNLLSLTILNIIKVLYLPHLLYLHTKNLLSLSNFDIIKLIYPPHSSD